VSASSHKRSFLWEGFGAYAVWLFPSPSNSRETDAFLLNSIIERNYEQPKGDYDRFSELQGLGDDAEYNSMTNLYILITPPF
jgi:hypothetical protein